MNKRILSVVLGVSFIFATPRHAYADLFGGDVVVLTQILAQAIMQLSKLRDLMGNASAHLDLIRQINRGINDSLQLLRTIDPNLDPGIYREWQTVNEAVRGLTEVYGEIPDSPEARIQRDADQGAAEAVAFNNFFYKHSEAYDRVAKQIDAASHAASPGGAQKISAQALGVVIQLLNQQIRANATGLKLQAQKIALENRKEKAETKLFMESTQNLRASMKSEKVRFQLPRF